MTSCIFMTSQVAGFFGHSCRDVVTDAAEFLLGQLPHGRLEWMVQEGMELEIHTLCTPMRNLGDNKGFFLQFSTQSSSGLPIDGGFPEDLLALTTYAERIEFVKSLVFGAIDSYEMCTEDAFETPHMTLDGSWI